MPMPPTQGTMQELWDTTLRYLTKCNTPPMVRGLHRLAVEATPTGVEYVVEELELEGNIELCRDADLEKVACWLKVYVSWED